MSGDNALKDIQFYQLHWKLQIQCFPGVSGGENALPSKICKIYALQGEGGGFGEEE
jgi:hypothetical protein